MADATLLYGSKVAYFFLSMSLNKVAPATFVATSGTIQRIMDSVIRYF